MRRRENYTLVKVQKLQSLPAGLSVQLSHGTQVQVNQKAGQMTWSKRKTNGGAGRQGGWSAQQPSSTHSNSVSRVHGFGSITSSPISNSHPLDFSAAFQNIYPSSMNHSLPLTPTVILFSPCSSLSTLRWFIIFDSLSKFYSYSSYLSYFSPLGILFTSTTSLRIITKYMPQAQTLIIRLIHMGVPKPPHSRVKQLYPLSICLRKPR